MAGAEPSAYVQAIDARIAELEQANRAAALRILGRDRSAPSRADIARAKLRRIDPDEMFLHDIAVEQRGFEQEIARLRALRLAVTMEDAGGVVAIALSAALAVASVEFV
jgi:hypothetical protein